MWEPGVSSSGRQSLSSRLKAPAVPAAALYNNMPDVEMQDVDDTATIDIITKEISLSRSSNPGRRLYQDYEVSQCNSQYLW